jgi:peptidoglycan lytic transglycosylase B
MKRILLLVVILICPMLANAQAKLPWHQWVAQLRAEAVSQGIRGELFDDLFRNIRPSKRIIRFDRKQPEKRLTLAKYKRTRASRYKINLGRKELRRYNGILTRVGQDYGVSPCFIVALWGMESSYGRYMGNFPVIKSLATLAYDNRRAAFFRKQLLVALRILNDGHVSRADFRGEWAGASGHPQFLPTSWYRFAVDYDQDGRRDIWRTKPDVFASIANYLKGNGWQAGQPWGTRISLPGNFPENMVGKRIVKSVGQWREFGIHALPGEQLAPDHVEASVITPHGGSPYLIYNNFKTLLRYNNSIYYAATVGYMADEICQPRRR